MLSNPLKLAAVLVLSAGVIAAGLGASSGQETKEKDKSAPVADREADHDARFAALERRLRELELKLDSLATPPDRKAGPDGADAAVIRPRFDNALVETVYVDLGRPVKKGEILVEVKSTDVATARNDLLTRYVRWDRDHKYLLAREPLAREGRITQIIWTDTQNDEKRSRLEYLIARDRLETYGSSGVEIDDFLKLLDEERPNLKVQEARLARTLASLTIVSPIDGVVTRKDAVVGNLYDKRDTLFVIAPPKP